LDDVWMMEIVDGDGAEELLGTVMPAEGRAMTVLRAGRGLVVDSLPTTRDLRVPALRRFGSAMYAPLQTDDRELGVLVLLRHPGRPPFDEADRETAEAFAAQAALALVLSEARHAQDVASLLD